MMILFWQHSDVLEPLLKKLPDLLPLVGDDLKKSGAFASDVSKVLKNEGGNPVNAEKITGEIATILGNTTFPTYPNPSQLLFPNEGSKTALKWAAFTLRTVANKIKIQVPSGVSMDPKTVNILGFDVVIPDGDQPENLFHISLTREVPSVLNDASEALKTTANMIEKLETDTINLIKQTHDQMSSLSVTFGTAGRLLHTTGNYVYCTGKLFRLESTLPSDQMQCPPPGNP
jgi:hypothetical protein